MPSAPALRPVQNARTRPIRRSPSYHATAARCATISASRTLRIEIVQRGQAIAGRQRHPAIERTRVRDFIVGEQSRARLHRERPQEREHADRTDGIVSRHRVRSPATQVFDHHPWSAQERREPRVPRTHETPGEPESDQHRDGIAAPAMPVEPLDPRIVRRERTRDGQHERPVKGAQRPVPDQRCRSCRTVSRTQTHRRLVRHRATTGFHSGTP